MTIIKYNLESRRWGERKLSNLESNLKKHFLNVNDISGLLPTAEVPQNYRRHVPEQKYG